MSPRRQPSEDRLLAYAAGTLSPPEAVVVATHLALRPETRDWTELGQALGGVFLDDLEPLALDERAADAVLARLDAPSPSVEPALPKGADASLPPPLRHFPLGPWRWLGPGVHVETLATLIVVAGAPVKPPAHPPSPTPTAQAAAMKAERILRPLEEHRYMPPWHSFGKTTTIKCL